MSALEEFEDALCNAIVTGVLNVISAFTTAVEQEYASLDCAEKDIQASSKEGVLIPSFEHESAVWKDSSIAETVRTNRRNATQQNVQEKENVSSNVSSLVEKRVSRLIVDTQIKVERVTSNIIREVIVKEENDMPPPKSPPKIKRNGRARPKVKQEILDNSVVEVAKDVSDVIVLDDSILSSPPVRVTRARTKARTKAAGNEDNVTEVQNDTMKLKIERTPSNKKKLGNVSNKRSKNDPETYASQNETITSSGNSNNVNPGVAELAGEQNTIPVTETYSASSADSIANVTTTNPQQTTDDLMTDDEDPIPDSPQCTTVRKKLTQFFSPYENTPVVNRVAAFEKLGIKHSSVTRSKTKLPMKLHASSTPTTSVRSSKDMKLKSLTGSALKASQMEYRERELRRKQKEEEALQKKEALMQAQTEGRRRRREEREMKVQQLKMEKEKEKQRQLMQAEKVREEKFKQMLAGKEARFVKQKEEAAARKRAAAIKRVEDKHQEVRQVVPAYLTHSPPLMPTADCYDSDDSTSRGTYVIPHFQRPDSLRLALLQMESLKHCKKLLYRSSFQTPNLQTIFPTIQASKLKRTSSAIWNQTEISILEAMIEED